LSEQAAVLPKHPKTKGAGGLGGEGVETEGLAESLYEGNRMRDQMSGWAKTLANKTVKKTKTWKRGLSTEEALTEQEERDSMGRIKDRFSRISFRPRLTSGTFQKPQNH